MIHRKIHSAIVTGPTGTIGNALIKKLREELIEVYAIVNPDSSRISEILHEDMVHIIKCDISEIKNLKTYISENIDAFFHLAWIGTTGPSRNDIYTQIRNIKYTIDAVDVAKDLGCQIFVGAGSQAEHGTVNDTIFSDTPCFPENAYGMAKLCAGQMSRLQSAKLGINHVWMRVLSVYGPHDWIGSMISSTIMKLLRREKPALTAGEQLWDYLYCDDAANAFYLAALSGKNGATYPLGSGIAKPLREYVEILRDLIDPNLPLGFGEIPYESKQIMHLQADISSLHDDTGFTPEIDFPLGIKKAIIWMKKR